jgi:putative membrane protein
MIIIKILMIKSRNPPSRADIEVVTLSRVEEIKMFGKSTLLGAAALLALSGAALAHDGTHPSDAQIAHIAYTAGQIDIEAGRQALARSRNPAVRSFAEEMVRDHQAVNDQAVALVTRLGVTPAANETSAALAAQAAQERQRLGALEGEAFDRAYIANEIAFHRTVNGALSGTLIPGAHNAELKSLLETGLTLFREHQAHAEHVAQSVR